jgi:hypothetical protein
MELVTSEASEPYQCVHKSGVRGDRTNTSTSWLDAPSKARRGLTTTPPRAQPLAMACPFFLIFCPEGYKPSTTVGQCTKFLPSPVHPSDAGKSFYIHRTDLCLLVSDRNPTRVFPLRDAIPSNGALIESKMPPSRK